MHRFTNSRGLHPHHRYQLGVVLYFMLGLVLFLMVYLIMSEQNADPTVWQWYFVAPWAIIYTLLCLRLRGRITKGERTDPRKHHIVSWIVLGLAIIMFQTEPVDLERLYSVDLLFILFSLLLADSYWDFQQDSKHV